MSWLNGSVKRTQKNFSAIRGRAQEDIPFSVFLTNTLIVGLGGLLCFSAVHYAGAFVNIGKAFQQSFAPSTLTIKPDTEARKILAMAQANIKYTKIFLRKEQAVEAEYALPTGARLDLHVLRCKQFPVLEVFRCNPIAEQTITITDRTRGASTIFLSDPGFYYFTETVTMADETQVARYKDYAVRWRRA